MTRFTHRPLLMLVGLIASLATVFSSSAYAQTTSYQYNDQGLVMSDDGPRTDVVDVTTYDYTPQGWLTSRTNALGHVQQWLDHNARGLPERMIDANGIVTEMTYNARQELINAA